jgi:hypothetical protein
MLRRVNYNTVSSKRLSVIDNTSVEWTRRVAINQRQARQIIANLQLLHILVPPRVCLSTAYQHGIPTRDQRGGRVGLLQILP